ncbi:MAG: hypothetical protein ACRCYV_01740 [Aeromonas sp.]
MTYRKLLFLTAILPLSGFYLFTLYLAAHPQVSLSYRLYYIEKMSRFWQHNSTMEYYQQPVDLTQASRFLSFAGWGYKPTPKGTPLIGTGQIMWVQPAASVPLAALSVSLTLHSPAASTLTARLGSASVTVPMAAGEQQIQFTLPAQSASADRHGLQQLHLSPAAPIHVSAFTLRNQGTPRRSLP